MTKLFNGDRTVPSANGARKTEYPHVKSEVAPLSNTIYKN